MSQAPSVVSPTQSINPTLQAALSSLDIQLEEELTRYRRQRGKRPVMSAMGHSSGKSIDLISLEPTAFRNQSLGEGLASEATSAPNSADGYVETTPAAQTIPNIQQPSSSTYASSTDFSTAEPAHPSPEHPADGRETSRMASVGGNLVYQGATPVPPEDYLESSEQLLWSLADEETQIQTERRVPAKWLTPLAAVSILILLFCCALLGYLVVKQTSNLGMGSKPRTSTVAPNKPQKAPATDSTVTASPIVNGPNLAADEFVDLNLNTLPALKKKSSAVATRLQPASPTAVVNPGTSTVVKGNPKDLADALLPPSVQPPPDLPPLAGPTSIKPTAPTPSSQVPKPTPSIKKTPATSVSATKMGPSSTRLRKDYYYVLTNYVSPTHLAQVRKIAQTAYMINFPDGERIQVAAFNKEYQALTFAQELQQKGISAWVYHP